MKLIRIEYEIATPRPLVGARNDDRRFHGTKVPTPKKYGFYRTRNDKLKVWSLRAQAKQSPINKVHLCYGTN